MAHEYGRACALVLDHDCDVAGEVVQREILQRAGRLGS
jgi:hypothetical protein